MHKASLLASALAAVILNACSSTSSPSASQARQPRVIVQAGAVTRERAVVQFQLPAHHSAFTALATDGGKPVPLQVGPDGLATFVVDHLPANSQATFRLLTEPPADPSNRIEVRRVGQQLRISHGSQTLFDYQAEPGPLPRPNIKPIYSRGGFIHPIFTPGGRLISDSYATNHLHQHGIWFAWTKTEFEGRHPDFWNMGDNTGTVEFMGVDKTWSGSVHGGFQSHHRYIDLGGGVRKPVLDEEWTVQAYSAGLTAQADSKTPAFTLFDLTSEQQCTSASPLTLPLYHYGGLGFRGNEQWNNLKAIHFLTSEGETDREKANATRARWCYIGGAVNGQQAGIVILCHPDNFRAPQPMRVHPKEPFFCYAPSQGGDWQIVPGKKYTSRYRFVVFDGVPDKPTVEKWWNDYANPPMTRVETK